MRASPFFEDIKQIDLNLDGHDVKLPIHYYDGSAMTGIFPAKLSVLRRFLPDRRFSPARLAPGVGTVSVTCFEYVDTDIGSYNELAIGIPLNVPHHRANLPGRALLEARITGQMHAFVHHLPVTTEIALVAGKRLWNYPKFVAGIDFTDTSDKRICRLSEGEEHILTMSCDRISTRGGQDVQVFSHLWHQRQPQSSEFKLRAARAGEAPKPGVAQLELGHQHPISRELREALISTKSIAAQWWEGLEGILYGPEHLMLPLVDEMLHEAKGEAPKPRARTKAKAKTS
jgi:hypothetical protein